MKHQPTVPVSEFGITGIRDSDVEAWATVNGVTLVRDYLGRLAVSLDDAYKAAERREEAEREAQQRAAVTAAVANAQNARKATYEAACAEALAGKLSTPKILEEARRAGWAAVRESERDLPAEVRDRLGGIPGGGLVAMFRR
ncbi:hypothetical protein [Intrasporangium sp.]|uniref:hypothetical protein n=1 Tax=Intrasporangium sp. TaxID=1925024 RepID=UPI003221F3ED